MVVSDIRKGEGVIVKQNFHFLLKILLYCLNLAGGRGRGPGGGQAPLLLRRQMRTLQPSWLLARP